MSIETYLGGRCKECLLGIERKMENVGFVSGPFRDAAI